LQDTFDPHSHAIPAIQEEATAMIAGLGAPECRFATETGEAAASACNSCSRYLWSRVVSESDVQPRRNDGA
jgi:hypothetical protein